jgi:hypothetical protein
MPGPTRRKTNTSIFLQKRRRMEDIERKNIDVLIAGRSGVPVQYSDNAGR